LEVTRDGMYLLWLPILAANSRLINVLRAGFHFR
jgi:hypothetical protein